MQITYKFHGNGRVALEAAGGAFTRQMARAGSRDANTFTNTIPADVFAQIVAFVGNGDDETVFSNLRSYAVGFQPEGMSAKSTKAKRVEQAARINAIAAL